MFASSTARRRAIRTAAPAAGLLAAALLVWQGSYAAFSATTTNPNNNWAAGSVSLMNDSNAGNVFGVTGSVAFNVSGLKPGSTGFRCIVVQSQGTLPAQVRFYLPAGTESTTKALDASINLAVDVDYGKQDTNCTGFSATPTNIYNNTLANAAATATNYATGLGAWNLTGTPPEYSTYRITWTVPAAAPNTIQGGTAAATFTWESDNT
jgi:hypothetical protein